MDWTAFNNTITGLGNTAGNILSSLRGGGGSSAPQSPPAQPTTTKTDWTKYLPWMIGGGVVLLIVGIFAFRSK